MSGVEQIYNARLKRVKDAIALREPDRVPIVPVIESFPIHYAGRTIKECMYDWNVMGECLDKFYEKFQPDMGWDPIMMYPARFMEEAGLVWFRWPGKGIDDPNVMYQYIEDEYMKADEYPEAIYDITKFMLNKWLPRSFANLQGFSRLDFRNSMWFGNMGMLTAFGDKKVQESLRAAMRAGEVLCDWFAYVAEYGKKMISELGMPIAYGAFGYAPFDMIGDTMRGTEAVLLDMYERPEQLLALIDKITPFAIEDVIAGARASGPDRPYVWIWLHKGIDSFMSKEMFAKFYWPSLREYITRLAEAGLVPVVYVEGEYNTRLEYLREVPKGKVIYNFEYTDMAQAKKVLGDVACISGNIPIATLSYGSKQEVADICKRLIDTCAPGGGYILAPGALVDEAKEENMEVMFDTVMTYGAKK